MSENASFADLTDDELRNVAAIAAGTLLLDDTRRYGLTEGGPDVNRSRCDDALTYARERGIVPTAFEAQQAALDLIAEVNDA